MNKKRFLIFTLLIAMMGISAVVSGCASGNGETTAPTLTGQIIKDISNDEAYAMIQDNKDNDDFVIIDVRTPGEIAEGYIENALHIDFNSGNFREEIDKLDKDKTYLVYCRSGSRSAGARDVMQELGFREVYNMEGGIVEWKEAGRPLVK